MNRKSELVKQLQTARENVCSEVKMPKVTQLGGFAKSLLKKNKTGNPAQIKLGHIMMVAGGSLLLTSLLKGKKKSETECSCPPPLKSAGAPWLGLAKVAAPIAGYLFKLFRPQIEAYLTRVISKLNKPRS